MTILKIIRVIVPPVLVFTTCLIGWLFIRRLILPYNSEGNYFNETDSIVYHEQAVLVFGIITGFCSSLVWELSTGNERPNAKVHYKVPLTQAFGNTGRKYIFDKRITILLQ